jgi:hypothetical protein
MHLANLVSHQLRYPLSYMHSNHLHQGLSPRMIHQGMYFLPLSYYHVRIGKSCPLFMVHMGILEYSKVINPHSKFCVLHASVFSMNFLCSLNGHHPWEDVEKVAILPKKILGNLSINQKRSTNF